MTSASHLMGILEVTSNPFKDNTQIWKDKIYPCRVHVKAIIAHITPETAIPIKSLEGQLSIFNPERPKAWGGFFRSSPRKWKASDGEIIVSALLKAQRDPTVYSFI